MDTIQIEDKTFRPYLSEAKIQERIQAMAQEISQELGQEDLLFVCMLSGAFVFASDLIRALPFPTEIQFVKYSSYEGTKSCGELKTILPLKADLHGKTVVVLEDIVETGLTMQQFKQCMLDQGAKDCKVASLLFKPAANTYHNPPEYIGFSIANDFVVGYGLDYNQKGRNLRSIYSIV